MLEKQFFFDACATMGPGVRAARADFPAFVKGIRDVYHPASRRVLILTLRQQFSSAFGSKTCLFLSICMMTDEVLP